MNRRTGVVNRVLGKWGFRVVRTRPETGRVPYSDLFRNRRVPDVNRLLAIADDIPGMLSEESAKFLFSLCYAQGVEGDVVEVGSWQGYSTSFLARAVSETGNGRMYAVDHFKGNVGKEAFYVAGRDDLGDLPGIFRNNMRKAGVDDTVRILEMANVDACAQLRNDGVKIRFLFIDGDHSLEGVRRDIELFFPLLVSGAIVVFDDCSTSAPGVIEAADELFRKGVCQRAFTYSNTLVTVI